MAIVGLMPAAGYATRLGGTIDGSKEVQVLRGYPVMAYLLDRFRRGGADRIIVATRPEKTDVIRVAEAAGAEVVIGHPATVSASLLMASSGLPPDDVALFGFPDTVWSPADGFRILATRVLDGERIALGVFESPYPGRSDVVTLDAQGRIVRVDVKPASPRSDLVWAAGAARVALLRTILAEAEPGVAFDRLSRSAPVMSARLGRVIDIGLPDSLRDAAADEVFDCTDVLTSAGMAARPASRGPRVRPGPPRGR